MRELALYLAGLSAFFVGLTLEGCKDPCVIGSEGCDCTAGGACDPGLTCLSSLCVNAGPNPDENSSADETTGTATNTTSTSPETGDGDSGDGDGDGDGTKLDTLDNDTADDGPCVDTGCKKVDMLFAMDGSLSMAEEINALKSGQAFLSITSTLENINCGGIDYRIGVTGDNDNGWVTPNGWADPNPWFDSEAYTAAEISVHFQNAATQVGNSGGAPLGCEHVLSSAVTLLGNDTSGFLRDDALLVLVLMSDVDDYGWYDQFGGNDCGLGCQVSGQPVATLQDTLIALKAGDPAGVSAIVIAGDPMMDAGSNGCGQPQSCGGQVQAFHAERLYEFAMLQEGMNGYNRDICEGPSAVPDAVETALADNIDLACQEFQPEG
ncbi:hypothetical protein ENSA5_35500 [Enhygromyxa salina]|uniref:VWFA domain-containing protein n=1 Tax=Enhygromyxa salina TaxID=215803 RepID=A0A2S9XV76_9BACT|nr:hypothetical protein [Enhygromyxa salina]PRP96776.1 hypothetical protein ENSA5_35500 [Enhygromyxa salina]